MFLDAIIADDGPRREELAEELQVVCLSVTDVKDAQAFQTIVQTGRSDRCVIVHLQLEDVRSLAHLVENSHDDALGAEEGISTILAWFPVGEDLKIDAVCGPNLLKYQINIQIK